MTGGAHGRRGTRIDENVVLLRVQRSGLVEVRGRSGAARAGTASRRAVGDEMDRRDGAVLLRSDAQHLVGARTITDGKMLFFAIQHQPHRCARFLRQRRRHHAGIARSELGAETAAHEFRDDTYLGERNLEEAGQLFAHAGRALGRCPHRQHVGLPVRDYAMCFQRRVRLHLGDVMPFDNGIGVFKALVGFSATMDRWAVDVAGLTYIAGTTPATCTAFFVCRAGEDLRRVGGAGFV